MPRGHKGIEGQGIGYRGVEILPRGRKSGEMIPLREKYLVVTARWLH